jgi:hypothetical protein
MVRLGRRVLVPVLAVVLVAGAGVPRATAGDEASGAAVADVIERLRRHLDAALKRAAKASREGRSGEALELLLEAVTIARAGSNAAHNKAGREPPPKPKAKDAPGAAAVPKAPPRTPLPGARDYPLRESYDRFTGEASVRVPHATISASHKSTREKAKLYIEYVTQRSEAGQVYSHLLFGTNEAALIGPGRKKTVLGYFLVDGARSRRELSPSERVMDANLIERVELALGKADRESLFGATKVEMRVGDWEFEVPADFRAAASRADTALERLGR